MLDLWAQCTNNSQEYNKIISYFLFILVFIDAGAEDAAVRKVTRAIDRVSIPSDLVDQSNPNRDFCSIHPSGKSVRFVRLSVVRSTGWVPVKIAATMSGARKASGIK